MIPARVRQIRLGLLALIVLVGALVVLTFRRPPAPMEDPAEAPPAKGGAQARRLTGVEIRPLREGREVVLWAEKVIGREEDEMRLQGVTLHFTYRLKEGSAPAEVTSDECLYSPQTEQAQFSGHVKLHAADGFTLETESLSYDARQGLARTDAPFSFQRNDVSGRGRGFAYEAHDGTLRIMNDVWLRTEDDKGGTEIRSQSASYVPEPWREARFVGAVEVRRGEDVLQCGELILNLTETHVIERAQAVAGMYARFVGGPQVMAGAAKAADSDVREIKANKLYVWFRPDRSIEKMIEFVGEVVLHPGPSEKPETKTLSGGVLQFTFDTTGKLTEVEGSKGTQLKTESKARGATPLTMSCRRFTAHVDPTTGEMETAELMTDFAFVSGARRGSSEMARYRRSPVPGGVLTLTGDPELTDSEQGSRLSAEAIDIEAETGSVDAHKNVRHVMGAVRAARKRAGPAPPESAVASCEDFHYDARTHVARYREKALMRSHTDELRAREIVVRQGDTGRHLDGEGDVVSIVSPRGPQSGSPIEVRSQRVVYEESERRVEYTGDVVMRQQGITTRSPRLILFLTADGDAVERAEAGEPVVAEQGRRVVSGSWGVYRPAERTLTLTGAPVTLRDTDGQSVRGRSLTFKMGEDSILIDGREEVRTEAVFRGSPLKESTAGKKRK